MGKRSSIRLPYLRGKRVSHEDLNSNTGNLSLTSTCPFYCVVFKGITFFKGLSIWNCAYHTFSNFVSSSRKLKFRPIIIKRPPKPTFSWYVLQARSIAFKSFLSFSTYTVSKLPESSCACPSLGLCSPRGSSHSTIVAVSLSLLLPTGWAPGGEPLMPGDAPCRVNLAPWHCGDLLVSTSGQDCLQLTSAMACRLQVLLAGLKLNVWSQWPRARGAVLRWYMMDAEGGEEEQVLPCCSIQGKKYKGKKSRRKKYPEKLLFIESTKS